MTSPSIPITCFVIMWTTLAAAGTSTNYSISPSSLMPGGSGSSANYKLAHGTMGPISGFSSVNSYSIRHGYAPAETGTPDIDVEQPAGFSLTTGSSTVDFGEVVTGTSVKTFVIRNQGDGTLNLQTITFDGSHASDFMASTPSSSSVAPMGSVMFNVTFTPGVAGARTATLQIPSNDPDESPFTVALTATAIPESTIDAWKTTNTITDPTNQSDGDNDLVDLLKEYAFNLDPNANDFHILTETTGTSGLPFIDTVQDTGPTYHLEIEFIRRRGDTNLTYTVQFGDGPGDADMMNASGGETVTPIDLDWERVRVSDTVVSPPAGRRFGRVRVILPSTP